MLKGEVFLCVQQPRMIVCSVGRELHATDLDGVGACFVPLQCGQSLAQQIVLHALSLPHPIECFRECHSSSCYGQTASITKTQANGTDQVARADEGLKVSRDEEAHIQPSRAAQKIRLRHGV
ncbi:hypothetical protein KWM_0104765 [Xanthomonas vasicola pv. musacearum NCPPB 2005]|nr:hypothetical protein KWQ_0112880 [Xanthomonas vasicola pv. musacearum NCPPB 4380]KFA12017.1 hypothetical protein KWM_0104765 [Xanthomonas vasicola pv. musacearum NCPPB 2005]KFA17312.1 hypothetical protein A11G_0114815 [Xanthomonas vasicola pv. musacearum NCPPB 4392]KFA17981.1 hypothetical protein KWU_0120220 [Xanthomonas vasicola pv. musacearum NCPPB 4394]KFA24954.1 hypothetical protein KWS_0120200 [Xanthomonas vasicola pv. musacearum NCPPB 4384]